MSNLLNDNEGRNVVLVAQKELLERRIARFFERNLVVDYEQWSNGGEFDLATLLGDLNVAWDDELRDLYRLLGHIGGLNESVQDETIYVNSTTGSDTEGTGSAAEPYASLWFLSNLPNIIGHDYRVLITGDIDMEDTIDIDVSFVGEGCLSIIGVGAAVDPYGGIFNGAVTNEWAWNSTLHSIELSNPPTVAVNRYFYRATSGGDLNRVAPVSVFSGTRVHVRLDPTINVAVADNYSWCIPANTINCYGLNLNANNGGNIPRLGLAISSVMSSRINFVNLNIRIDENRDDCFRNVYTSGAPMGFWFCRLLVPDFNNNELVVFSNDINMYNPTVEASLLENDSQSGITNTFIGGSENHNCAGFFLVERDNDKFTYWGTNFSPIIKLEKNARIATLDCMAQWRAQESNVKLWKCCAGSVNAQNSDIYALNVWVSMQENVAGRRAIISDLSSLNWVDSVLGQAEEMFNITCSFLRMNNVQGTVGIGTVSDYDYIVRASGMSKVFLSGAWVGNAPVVNDIYFPDPAAPIAAAFPGAGALQTDALENTVMRPA